MGNSKEALCQHSKPPGAVDEDSVETNTAKAVRREQTPFTFSAITKEDTRVTLKKVPLDKALENNMLPKVKGRKAAAFGVKSGPQIPGVFLVLHGS
ncbi:uncharacterized protein N7500_002725 [Penicillium coprophilum]|uniref:uncharacterized protein n=1 Tax=Penicillium coprophilum TaxID=36646 RepID=UPI002389BD43|nr:uncharacterized protein N7500_002725 [Penicillium coprophilum]KAJ5169942.1 hypothetical protein N7500_002725 [Penicillium coprophilum]